MNNYCNCFGNNCLFVQTKLCDCGNNCDKNCILKNECGYGYGGIVGKGSVIGTGESGCLFGNDDYSEGIGEAFCLNEPEESHGTEDCTGSCYRAYDGFDFYACVNFYCDNPFYGCGDKFGNGPYFDSCLDGYFVYVDDDGNEILIE